MYFQFLIEDMSSAELVKILMDKIAEKSQKIEYDCKYFHGLGGFTKKNTVKETKTGKLLNDLATYLKGFSKSLQNIQAAIIVVLDNDDRDTNNFQRQLREIAEQNEIKQTMCFVLPWKRWKPGCWEMRKQSKQHIPALNYRFCIAMYRTAFVVHGRFLRILSIPAGSQSSAKTVQHM